MFEKCASLIGLKLLTFLFGTGVNVNVADPHRKTFHGRPARAKTILPQGIFKGSGALRTDISNSQGHGR